MHPHAANILKENKDALAETVSNWTQITYPKRTSEYKKCTRDISYIIQAIIYCLEEGNTDNIDNISRMFFTRGVLQLKSLHVEFHAYNYLIKRIEDLLQDHNATEFCKVIINRLKANLSKETGAGLVTKD